MTARRDVLMVAMLLSLLSSTVVWLGFVYGLCAVKSYWMDRPRTFWMRLTQSDGIAYHEIAASGYSRKRSVHDRNSIAFFPAYPLCAHTLARLSHIPEEIALVALSNACFAASCGLIALWILERCRNQGKPVAQSQVYASVALLCLWPTSVFFRLAYSESMFMILVALCFYGMERKWPAFWIALLAGASTAVRAAGVATLVPVLIYTGQHIESRYVVRIITIAVVSLWGIIAFCAYQWLTFGDPVAFVRAQSYWSLRDAPMGQQAVCLLVFEPGWSVYRSDSPGYWARVPGSGNPLFNLQFANPLYFAVAVITLLAGSFFRIINSRELGFGLAVLAIPYVTHAFAVVMGSHGRYAAVCLPFYLVGGMLLAKRPCALFMVLAASTIMLFAYAALFVAGYSVY